MKDANDAAQPLTALKKPCYLRKSADFQRVYRGGKQEKGRYVAVFYAPNKIGQMRFGLTVSRKFSPRAVDRNRAKRVLRAAIQATQFDWTNFKNSFDLVFNARRALAAAKSTVVADELREIFLRLAHNAADEKENAAIILTGDTGE